MTILEMIAEWHRGCSDATPEHPEDCHTCTIGLIDAIERQELKRIETDKQKANDDHHK